MFYELEKAYYYRLEWKGVWEIIRSQIIETVIGFYEGHEICVRVGSQENGMLKVNVD